MKILLSAFNCNPYLGSEHGRGWAWVTELVAAGHEIWVLTKADNQSNIEKFLATHPLPNCQFIYHAVAPATNTWWKFKDKQIGTLTQSLDLEWRLLVWQWEAYQKAKELTQQVQFDCVHHVTNTCIRRYSLMGFLGIPFIMGPVSGGVKTPWALRKSYSFVDSLMEIGRDLANEMVRFNPLSHLTFAKASKIYCDASQTQALLGPYRSRSQILFSMPPCRISPSPEAIEQRLTATDSTTFKVLYAGRFMCWKGMHLGLRAFARLYEVNSNSRLTMIGEGREGKRLRQLADELQIQPAIDWIPWMNQADLGRAYLQHDVLLFPSLHEMGGNVILEALAHGLPTICLNIGGPGVMVNETCGRVIQPDGLTEDKAVEELSKALIELMEHPQLRQKLSKGALERQEQFAWKHVVAQIYP